MSLLFFAIKNAFRKKSVALLSILGVAFGTALMVFLFSLASGMDRRAERTFSALSNRIMISGRDALYGGVLLGMGTSPIPASYTDDIKNLEHVQRIYTQVSVIMRPVDINYNMPLFGYGVEETAGITGLPSTMIIEGGAPANDNEIIIGKSLLEYLKLLNVTYETGSTYQFIVPDAGKTRVKELKVTGVYQTGNEVLDSAISGTDKLAREIGKIPVGKISVINMLVDGVENVEPVTGEIQQALSGKSPEVQAVAPTNILNPVRNILGVFGKFLMAVSLVAVVAGGLSILVVMLLSVVNRMREFGILKALGWTPGNIIFMVLIESLFLSLFGTAMGIGLGYAGIVAARAFIADDIAALTWQVIAMVGLAGVMIGVAGGIYPAWRANKASPAKIFRDVS